MTIPDIGIQRLQSQGLAQPAFATPPEAVRWLGAMQAQDFLGSMWAIGCRMQRATEQGQVALIEQAIAERTIVRTWPMRGTVHFVPGEDARWMVNLMAPRVIAQARGRYRQAGLDEAVFARSRDIFVRALEGGRQQTRGALYARLEAEGIATANSRGLHIIGRLAQEGLICFSSRQGKQPTFALLDEWVSNTRSLTREESLAEIIVRYFRSHGPATIHDFIWWSGLRMADARAGLEAVQSQLVEERIDGKTYWWATSTPNVNFTSPAVYLLPPYDEYMVSYKDRSAALDPQNDWLSAPQRHLSSIIVIDGRVVGTWKRTFQGGGVVIESTCARTLTSAERQGFEAAAQRYGQFLAMEVLLVSVSVRSGNIPVPAVISPSTNSVLESNQAHRSKESGT